MDESQELSAARDEIAAMMARARAAQAQIADYTQEQVDLLITAMVWAVAREDRSEEIARFTVEETQLEYNAMQESPFQLLMAKREEIAAGVAYVEELRDYWIAKAELARILAGAWQSEQQFEFEQSEPLMSQSVSPFFFLQAP